MNDNQEQRINNAREKDPMRLLALSDGVFATVLTLLVLDLRIPDALNVNGGDVPAFLRWFGPHFFSYLMTFLVAGTYWLGHHRDFDRVAQVDLGLLGFNLLFLLFIGLLPFSTATISLTNFSTGSFPFYWAIYASNIILAGIMLNLTWNYAVSHHLINQETTPRQSRHITLRKMVTPAVFLVSIAASYLFPNSFLGLYTLWSIPFVTAWVDSRYADAYPKTPPATGRSELLWRIGRVIPWLLILGLAFWTMTLH
jgi:uncharacterized membrane protein